MKYWQEIERKIDEYELNVDKKLIKMAFFFAEESHVGQFRKSGDRYIIHPIEVTKILIEMKMDTDGIIAGILHDIVEDTLITIADIKYNFGETVALLVDGVTKLENLPSGTKKQDENIRKMILAMSKDVRVIIVKLADRLHNMRTLKFMPEEKQKKIAEETLSVYAPLAHRLGMSKIKFELEDLALYYTEPEKYKQIKNLIDEKKDEREKYSDDMVEHISKLLKLAKIDGFVKGRFKHFYSIYKKMFEKKKEFDGIYDLIGIRIILETEAQCYNTLGVIHSNYRPVPGRFKDYIAVPKSNNYQSIHTTIVGPFGKFVEIQIRTKEMDTVAEDGIAAHWRYKENADIKKEDKIYAWLKKLVAMENLAESTEDFIKEVTSDIVQNSVFVFSPKGDIVELGPESTPIDFAFFVHTEVGLKCVGAKVNDKIVPLDYKLKNGDRVEVITSKNSKGPGNDWLDIVGTQSAKNKIKKWMKEQSFEKNIKIGKEILEKELHKLNINLKEFEDGAFLKKHLSKHNIPTLDDFYFSLGETKSKVDLFMQKLKIEEEKNRIIQNNDINDFIKETVKKKNNKKDDQGIVIDGTDNTLVRFAKCCTPMPGDEIGGYVTKITGITIHRSDCKNYMSMIEHDPNRKIEVNWDDKVIKSDQKNKKYEFTFTVIGNERPNLLIDVVTAIANNKINLLHLNTNVSKKGNVARVIIKITVEINNQNDFKLLSNHLSKLKDVLEVSR